MQQQGRFGGRARRRFSDASGFTLVELLVVMVIIAALCAIAIPSFAGQKAKASDAQAKELARTAQTTAELISTEADGSYEGVTVEALHSHEPTIPVAPGSGGSYLKSATGGEREYSVTAVAPEGDELTITRSASGQMTRECRSPVTHTGCAGGAASSW